MAGPVGHIVCALAMLNSGHLSIDDDNAFLVGTSFPDIRYITDINRTATHNISEKTLAYLMDTNSSFEAGRRFHVMVDHAREKHMLNNDAYSFVPKGPMQTQMLKIVEDDILFSKIKDDFDSKETFKEIYDEEISFGISRNVVQKWHHLLSNYLSNDHLFDMTRYYSSLTLFEDNKNLPKELHKRIWYHIKTFSFFVFAFYKIKMLARDPKLKQIILDFYEHPLDKMFPAQGLRRISVIIPRSLTDFFTKPSC